MKKENRIFAVAAILVIMIDVLFAQDEVYKISPANTVVLLAAVLTANVAVICMNKSKEIYSLVQSVSMVALLFLAMVWSTVFVRLHYVDSIPVIQMLTIGLGFVLLAFVAVWALRYRDVTEEGIFLLLMMGLMLRTYYVVMTQAHIYQNDTGTILSDLGGHLGYVRYIVGNHALPDFDPVTRHQFYQPPLYYVITAVWVRLHTMFGMSLERVDESIQLLSLFYSVVSLGYLNKIGLRLKISALGRFLGLGIAVFLPYGIMMSGSTNNDALMLMFMIMSVYYTVKWYQDSKLLDILWMGLTIGCAMMTKISGVLIAPGIACIMLYKAWKERQQWRKYLGWFAAFGAVAFPLGLWHPLKSLLVYGMPLGYVPNMGTDSSQYIGMYQGVERIFGVGDQLKELCLHWDVYAPYIDYNIPISLVKFSVFGEGVYHLCNEVVLMMGNWTFWFTVVIFGIMAVGNVIGFFQKNQAPIFRISLGIMIFVIMFSYINFCYMYPHVCTMHVRYVMAALYLGALGAGAAVSGFEEKLQDCKLQDNKPQGNSKLQGKKRLRVAVSVAVVVFICIYGVLSVLLNWNMEILLQS